MGFVKEINRAVFKSVLGNFIPDGMLDEFYYQQNIEGDHFYQLLNDDSFPTSLKRNELIAQSHPILTTVIGFVSSLFAQAEFWIEDKNGDKIRNHWVLDLLKNPQYSITQSDFLESVYATKVTQGTCVLHKNGSVAFNPTKLRILDLSLIEFPDVSYHRFKSDDFSEVKVIYDREGENTKIALKNLIFFRDLPLYPSNLVKRANGTINLKYKFISKSRIDGLRTTLLNTVISLHAKKVILNTNGKELFSGSTGESNFPFNEADKEDVEEKINSNYGLGIGGRSRAIVTKSTLNWKSLHIALRDLGLDESVKVDGNIIYTAFKIPRDIISLDLKKASYQNQQQSIVSYHQNDLTPMLKDFIETFQLMIGLEDGYVLRGNYDHLPVMKYTLLLIADIVNKQADALLKLLKLGMDKEDALELVGLDKDLDIDITKINYDEGQEIEAQQGSNGEDAEDGQAEEEED